MNRILLLSFIILVFQFFSCSHVSPDYKMYKSYSTISDANTQLSMVMLDNIFPPTVAARNYAYSNIAAYEVFCLLDSQLISFNGKINGLNIQFDVSPYPKADKYLASICAFYNIANLVTFPEGSFIPYKDTFLMVAKKNHFANDVIEDSKKMADDYTTKFIQEWVSKDMYAQTRSASKYSIPKEEDKWLPTPPGYFQAVEPHWNEIRSLCLDKADQFIVSRPPPFSLTDIKKQRGEFFRQTKEVYDKVNNLTPEEQHIADFWDCNPYAINVVGHVTYSIKKLSPGGHWMSIAGVASKKANASFEKSLLAHTLTAIGLFDAFISCWDEKYRSNLVRPETVINRHINAKWKPYLQTPPFPSYTSGHSCISTAAATMLTKVFGDNFSYTDNSELDFGIPNRDFKSFIHASQEAAISRFYGGIHYMFDIEVGILQGKLIASQIEKTISDIIHQQVK